jgi:hypothetical protein
VVAHRFEASSELEQARTGLSPVVAVGEEEHSSWTNEEDEQAGSGVERAHHRWAVAARTLRSGRQRFGEEERSSARDGENCSTA